MSRFNAWMRIKVAGVLLAGLLLTWGAPALADAPVDASDEAEAVDAPDASESSEASETSESSEAAEDSSEDDGNEAGAPENERSRFERGRRMFQRGEGARFNRGPGSRGERQSGGEADEAEGADGDEPEMISLAFRNMSMEDLAKFISEKLGKPVIPHESIRDRRITIVSSERMPLPAAMRTLREAMHLSGVIMEEHDLLISLRPIEDVAKSNLPILGDDESLSAVDDRAKIVRKVFRIEHDDPNRIKDAIVPMLPEYGSVVADANTGKLVVTDSVSGLLRIEQVIRALDVESLRSTVRKIIPLESADAAWVVSIIRLTISGDESAADLSIAGGAAQNQQRSPSRGRRGRPGSNASPGSSGASEVVAIQSEEGPVLLVPEVSRNWIVAVAPAATMKRIEGWVKELDQPGNVQEAFSMHDVRHADVNEVASQLAQVVESMPNLQESLRVVPFAKSRKLVVFGSARGQRLIRDLLADLDSEDAGNEVMKVVQLQYADAETVASAIEELFSGQQVQYQSRWTTRYTSDPDATQVKVAADVRRNSLTIVTDAGTLARIEALIHEQWDQPLDSDEVQPKVYRLKHADPVQVQELLTSLFSEQQQSFSPFSFFYGGGGGSDSSPVGRLFGQFSFQSLPNSDQLVVTTKNSENYLIIDRLIEDLDQPQAAGVPHMIELKHANAEDLAEQINATLAEPGTLAEILRTERDLSREDYSSGIAAFINTSRSGGGGGGGGAGQQGQQDRVDPDAMRFWWQQSQRNPSEQPSSNLIGKVRVVPVARRNALMVLAPEAYRTPIIEMISDLDRPGSQVIIRAVIAEVQHDDTTTLGVRLASDPAALSDPALADQSIGGSANADFNELFASPFEIGSENFARGIFNANLNLNVLLQLLIREFGLKILTEPKLYTADNEEAEFFDGRDVSIQTLAQTTNEGTLNRSFTYVPIGTQLRVRPHITKEGDVALRINLVLSSISPGENTFGNPIFDRRETSTHVIVRDGQTIMLSGIVRQEQFRDVRKLPLLGDIPLVGGVFRSTDTGVRNRELIIFITPEVVANTPEATEEAMIPYREKLQELRGELDQQDIVREPVMQEDKDALEQAQKEAARQERDE